MPQDAQTTAVAVAKPPKPPLVGGGRIAAIVPQDIESVFRLANVIMAAGMAPKSLDSVEKCTVAILHGLEVGFTPMAALQSIAVINGSPSIWGDGMIALVKASGLLEDIIETIEDNQEGPTIAVCKVKRLGSPTWVVQSFTRAQAMKAGLWKKQGPWMQYPQRMMQMRARSWALRDAFPDVLRGLRSAEEVTDMLDVTSTGSATTAPPEPRRSDYVHTADAAETTKQDPPHDPQTGEVKEDPPAETVDPWLAIGVGQEGIRDSILALVGDAKTQKELDAITNANGDRVKKFSQSNRAAITVAMENKAEDLRG